ncbi:MAG: hypothetical protein AAF481_08055 [Acidobacteriota bacterium]
MRSRFSYVVLLIVLLATPAAWAADAAFQDGPPPIQSMSTLAFGPEGVLLVGDAKGGAVVALDLQDTDKTTPVERFGVGDLETKIAALVGTRTSEVLIHDLATHPISGAVYLAVSRGRAKWESRWSLPNDLADASILLRIDGEAKLDEVDLSGVRWAKADLPDPVDPQQLHRWKDGVPLRAEMITDLVYDDGMVWVAGLSNEEFSSALWQVPYPFSARASKTTVEVFHGAHGKWETHSPVRTFVPYELAGKKQILAAYLCTPLAVFDRAALKDGDHVKGRTVAEFGSGNFPLDMVVYEKGGKEKLLIANSMLPLMIVDLADVEAFEGEITSAPGTYTAGVPYEIRSPVGIQQLDRLDDKRLVALQRMPSGTLDLVAMSFIRF